MSPTRDTSRPERPPGYLARCTTGAVMPFARRRPAKALATIVLASCATLTATTTAQAAGHTTHRTATRAPLAQHTTGWQTPAPIARSTTGWQ
ncbi:hypothetical protein T261_3459 [Streptomyces lydicus]|nr:hypothetical protein T261_3459 [Streptomyces lydicus]